MKMKDVTPGEVYGMDHVVPPLKSRRVWRGTSTMSFPKIKTIKKVKVVEVLPKGRALVEESWVGWDRDMMDNDKKPITKTKQYEVGTRSLKVI